MFSLLKKRPIITIVCTANITRSPYFAARLQKELEKLEIPKRKLPVINSAGVKAINGVVAHPSMQTIASMREISLRSHQSKLFDEQMAKSSDLVLTMEQGHADVIREKYPEIKKRVIPLLAFCRELSYSGETDIKDPTGGEIEGYEQFADIADSQAQRLRRFFKKNNSFF